MIQKPVCLHEALDKLLIMDLQVSASSHPDTDLNKVRSFEKRQELFNTLHSEHPDHYSRLHMVGFLKSVGYTIEEICAIIDQDCAWEDYDRNMTYCQVRSIFKPSAKDNETTTSISSRGQEKREFEGEKPAPQRGLSPSFTPRLCVFGNTRITCHFNNCDLCQFKDLAGRAEK